MARGGRRTNSRPKRYEFFDLLCDFASTHHGATPTHYGWWQLARRQGYTLAWTSFRCHTLKLDAEGCIRLEAGLVVIEPSRWELLAEDIS